MTLRQRLARLFLGDTIEDLVQQRLAKASHAGPVSVRVDDSPGWESLAGSGPADRPWADKYTDLEETLEAWQKNFFIRRLVTLTRSYALAGGLALASEDPDVDAFIQAFWHHRQNRLDRRMGPICDELTRAGEIFPILFTNRADGMSYVRFVPAFQIRTIETDPDDYEVELRYAQTRQTTAEPKWWIGPGHPRAFSPPPLGEGQGGGSPPPQRGGPRTSSPPPQRGGPRTGSPPPQRRGPRTSYPPPQRGGPRTSYPPPQRGGPRTSYPPPQRGGPRTGSPPPQRGGPRTGSPPPQRRGPRTSSPPPQRGGLEGGRNPLPPLMLHFAVNKPIGATRGESDLLPALPWAKRYNEWLKDRVRLNRIRTRQAILHLRISDPALVEQKRQQLRTHNPIQSGIYVSGPDEELIAHALRIGAGDAEDDGRNLRLAIATAGNVGLHFLGEGETVNYATAKEMGEPTTRFYAERQDDLIHVAKELVTAAYRRYCLVQGTTTGQDFPGHDALQLTATVTEVARKDNESLAIAARDIVQALAQMRDNGWIDDRTAIALAFQFAGEPLGQHQIERILANASPAGEG